MGPWFRYIASYDLSAAEALTRTLLGAKNGLAGKGTGPEWLEHI